MNVLSHQTLVCDSGNMNTHGGYLVGVHVGFGQAVRLAASFVVLLTMGVLVQLFGHDSVCTLVDKTTERSFDGV